MGQTLGSAVMATNDVAVMTLSGGGDRPSLPLQVLVPGAAGGTRVGRRGILPGAELTAIPVTEVVEAIDGCNLIALQLQQPVDDELVDVEAPRALGVDVVATAELNASDDAMSPNRHWVCKIFRICR